MELSHAAAAGNNGVPLEPGGMIDVAASSAKRLIFHRFIAPAGRDQTDRHLHLTEHGRLLAAAITAMM